MSNQPFNLAVLRETLKDIPVVKDAPKYFVCNAQGYLRLRKLLHADETPSVMVTAPVTAAFNLYQKPDQLRICWAFSSHETAMAYLEGNLTEQDLALMSGEGFSV